MTSSQPLRQATALIGPKRGLNETEKKKTGYHHTPTTCVDRRLLLYGIYLFGFQSSLSVSAYIHNYHIFIYLPPMPLLLLLPFSLSLAPPQMHSAIRGRYKTP